MYRLHSLSVPVLTLQKEYQATFLKSKEKMNKKALFFPRRTSTMAYTDAKSLDQVIDQLKADLPTDSMFLQVSLTFNARRQSTTVKSRYSASALNIVPPIEYTNFGS